MSPDVHFRIERLNPARHRREEFRCESPELTAFLQQRARKEMDAFACACFVLAPADDPGRIAGYYTLSASEITATDLPALLQKKLPRYPHLPATLLGRLARDVAWRGQDIGRLLLIDALRRSVRQVVDIGSVAVVTDPKDAKAVAFYTRHGFRPLDHRQLFLPMAEIAAREAGGWTD